MTTYFTTLIAAAALGASLSASAQSPQPQLDGDYDLASSTTVPASTWGFSKGRIAVRNMDDDHLLILLSCAWKREPKAVCRESYYAQWRNGGLYLQDMNTDLMRIYFDPAKRQLTIISRGLDAKDSVRRDIYNPSSKPLTDPALVRRMKNEESVVYGKETRRVFGPYQKWAYQNNRIEFQNQAPR